MKADREWAVSELRALEQMVHRAARKRDEQPAALRRALDDASRELDLLRGAETLAANGTDTFRAFARLVETLLVLVGEEPMEAGGFTDPLDGEVRRNGLADVVPLQGVRRSLPTALP